MQSERVVSSLSFAAMLFSGRYSDKIGRKRILIFGAFLYAISAFLSAITISCEILYIARIIEGLTFDAA